MPAVLIWKAGDTIQVDEMQGLGFDMSHYREFAFGATLPLNEKFEFGTRLKFLFGMANVYTARSDNIARSTVNNVRLDSDIRVNTSFPEEFNASSYAFNFNNPGLALDVALMWRPSEKWEITGIIGDLGFIHWTDNVTNYDIGGSGRFRGLSKDNIILDNENARGGASVDPDVSAAIEDSFSVAESQEAYTSPITAQSYLLADYKINKHFMAGGGIYLEYFQGIRPSFTANFQARTKNLEGIVSYSIRNGSYFNLGFGGAMTFGPLQFYLVQDNFIGMFRPLSSRFFNGRIGMNFVIGHNKYYEDDAKPSFE